MIAEDRGSNEKTSITGNKWHFWWKLGVFVSNYCREHTHSALIWYQNQVYTNSLWPSVYEILPGFSGSVNFEKSNFTVSYSCRVGQWHGRLQKLKMQNVPWGNVLKSVRNYMEMVGDIIRYVKTKETDESFFIPMPT